MTNTEPAYAATMQHVVLLAEKQVRLAEAQLAAEEQLLQAVSRETKLGKVTWHELRDLYRVLRDCRSPRLLQRWRAMLPDPATIEHRANAIEEHGDPQAEYWAGSYPYLPGGNVPGRFTCVVYILFDDANVPCYVGSTHTFKDRLGVHARDGKPFVRWQAHRCRDREHAYEVETRFLQQHKPYLNKKASR